MDSEIIVALITGLCAVLGQWLISRKERKKREDEERDRDEERKIAEAARDAKLEVWMQSVDKKLDEHNSYASRFGEIQTDIAVIKTDIKNIKERAG